ncbi:hypothetical protein ACQKKK_17115 [Peribacillus sp. NPDC006672]|uniref:hypothetical protein n=1 Tax=Peribacillus sp. NPDC006672 TaxID=3390606 RepID=UPI003D02FE66
MSEKEKLKAELDNLSMLSNILTSLIDTLEADLNLTQDKVEYVSTWKAGKARDSYLDFMSTYYSTFGFHLLKLNDISLDVTDAKKSIRFELAKRC